MDDPDNWSATHIESVPVVNNSVDDATAELIRQLLTTLNDVCPCRRSARNLWRGSVLAPQLQQVELNVAEESIYIVE